MIEEKNEQTNKLSDKRAFVSYKQNTSWKNEVKINAIFVNYMQTYIAAYGPTRTQIQMQLDVLNTR